MKCKFYSKAHRIWAMLWDSSEIFKEDIGYKIEIIKHIWNEK